MSSLEPATTRAFILESPDPPSVEIFGLSPVERLRRTLRAAGVAEVAVVTEPPAIVARERESVLLFRADRVYDERLVRALTGAANTVVATPSAPGAGEAVAAHVDAARVGEAHRLFERQEIPLASTASLRIATPERVVPAYDASLRKLELPFVLPAQRDSVEEIETRVFSASYKGVTDLITKWLWPAPALGVVRALARRGTHPNSVTFASWLLALLAVGLFAQGSFGLGLAAAWLMTFLDTVDGKLARVTLTSSRAGHVLDHGLDLLHPPFWYLAWAFGLAPGAQGYEALAAIVIAGYVVGRLQEGVFLLRFGIECHCWRPIDALFRTITARRNPNLILLTVGAAGGRPDLGLTMVAIWTGVSIGFHAVQTLQAFAARWRGEAIQPFDESRTLAPRPTDSAQLDRGRVA